ncbi:hypothetical protein WA026_015314 [Henosepilachna vigintioctopunctata]|uniref:Uncharacterized protein n=1 Tax=Henosepilachna vigintioctopunctata TaxID=420089 RepID=A0AAW1TL56_9CUCU
MQIIGASTLRREAVYVWPAPVPFMNRTRKGKNEKRPSSAFDRSCVCRLNPRVEAEGRPSRDYRLKVLKRIDGRWKYAALEDDGGGRKMMLVDKFEKSNKRESGNVPSQIDTHTQQLERLSEKNRRTGILPGVKVP